MPDISAGVDVIVSEFRAALTDIGAAEVETIRESVGTPGPPASAPGEPPHRRSGRLQASVSFSVSGDAESGLELTITAGGPTAPYAGIVEESRPFMAPALDRLRQSAAAELADRLRARFG